MPAYAVGRRGDHRSGRGNAAGARLVLNVEAAPEPGAKPFGDYARGDVGNAAGREGQTRSAPLSPGI